MTLQQNIHKPKGLMKRQLASLAVPIFIETLLIMTLGAIDTVMLSRHSDSSVAAVGVVNQIIMLCFLVFEVINLGTSVLCSQYLGAGMRTRLTTVVGVALAVNLLSGTAISILLYSAATPLLTAMGLNETMLADGTGYLRIVGIAAWVQAISMTASATLRACNKASYPMMVVGVVNVINIIGNYALIFGRLGMPALGVEGAAISTAVSRSIAMVLLLIILFRTTIRDFSISVIRRNNPLRELRNLLKIGLPSAGEQLSYSSSQVVITYFINMLGMEALATRTYTVNIVMFGYLFCIAISQGGAICIGHLVGQSRIRGAYLLGKYVMRLSIIVTVSLSIAIAFGGRFIFEALTQNADIIRIGTTILYIDIAVELGRAINIYATNALRATGDVNYPFYVGLIVMWSIAVAGGYVTGIVCGAGIIGMWAMFALDENIRGIIFVKRWNSFKWAGKAFTAN